MGFWGKLLGIGEIGAGIATANPGLVVSGAGTLAADSQNGSIQKANQQQQQATQQAQQKLDATYQQARADYAPYQQTGTNALGALNLGMGLQPLQPVTANAGKTYPTPQQIADSYPKANVGNLASIGLHGGTSGIVNAVSQTPQVQAIMANTIEQNAQNQTASSYVPMRSPDGRVGQVPASQVQAALKAGGTIIPNFGGANG